MFNPLGLIAAVRERIQPPTLIILGSPRVAADLAASLGPDTVCYQLDLHQSARLRAEFEECGVEARVETLPDLWDLPTRFKSVVFPVHAHGERELKLDMMEQAQHLLELRGLMVSISEYESDQLLPRWHKKIFGKCSALPADRAGSVYWSQKEKEHSRRRHEMTFHARIGAGPSHHFVSRPGVFSYGRMDEGSRALLENAEIEAGQSVLDLGCGIGTNGVLASDRAGVDASITFVDSNVRAIALAQLNADANGLTNFRTLPTASLEGLAHASFDVILANPPYYAHSSISQVFITDAKRLLRPGGSFWLVTKQVRQTAPVMVEAFGDIDAFEARGYTVLRGGT